MSRLATQLAGVELATPLVAASGTCGYIGELAGAVPLHRLGAVTTKSLTREPRAGNDPWRIIGVRGGMMNAIGLANMGVDRFVAEHAQEIGRAPCKIFASAAGHSIEEYSAVAAALDTQTAAPIIELNVSCPNTATGRQFGDDPHLLRALVAAARSTVKRAKLFVKLTPNADVVALAGAAVECGADGLTLTNTFPALAIDVETGKPRLSRGSGGMSGPGIHQIVVNIVAQVHRQVAARAKVPIIGTGGVLTWEDAAEFILAGATAVGVGTALFADPRAPVQIVDGLDAWVARHRVNNVSELVGTWAVPQ